MRHSKHHTAELANVLKVLADEQRVRILMALRGGELCICHITMMLELAPTAVNKHVSLLNQVNLVVERREGQVRWLRLPDESAPPYITELLDILHRRLAHCPRIILDSAALLKALKHDEKLLCAKQFWR